jgi:hypothetical protein
MYLADNIFFHSFFVSYHDVLYNTIEILLQNYIVINYFK